MVELHRFNPSDYMDRDYTVLSWITSLGVDQGGVVPSVEFFRA